MTHLKRSIVGSGIVLLLLSSFAQPVYALDVDFSDVQETHSNYTAIRYLKSRDIISGYPDGTFRPDQMVNRVEALKIILLGSGIEILNASGTAGFSDTKTDAWYAKFLIKAVALAIVQGHPDGTFKPEQTVNVVENLKILILSNNIDVSTIHVSQDPYADAFAGEWYARYVQFAKDKSLIDADPNRKIYPAQGMTRGKLAEVTYRLIKFYGGMTPMQKLRAEQLISLFENGTIEIQYSYTENLNDGRGITAGRAGFTTATADAYEVVKRYTEIKSGNILAKYLPELENLATNVSDDVSGLTGFESDWVLAANDPVFRSIQDEVVSDFYFGPSVIHSDELGLKTALARAVLYDTIIQHGEGEDPDGLPALIKRTNISSGGSPADGVDEKEWLNNFLTTRRENLANAFNEATRVEWAESVSRVDVFLQIAENGNYNLQGPIIISTEYYDNTIP